MHNIALDLLQTMPRLNKGQAGSWTLGVGRKPGRDRCTGRSIAPPPPTYLLAHSTSPSAPPAHSSTRVSLPACPPQAGDKGKDTPLHMVAKGWEDERADDFLGAAAALMAAGASWRAANRAGETAAALARVRAIRPLERLFKEAAEEEEEAKKEAKRRGKAKGGWRSCWAAQARGPVFPPSARGSEMGPSGDGVLWRGFMW